MKAHTPTVISQHQTDHGSLKNYVSGFLASVGITLTAYLLVNHRTISSNAILIGIVVGLALSQFMVQLVLFLQLGREAKPRWKLVVFLLMITVVSVLVGGSLWIMNNLNYHMMPSTSQQEQYMNAQNGL
jgi:cytochrome o ubiquinol oxidase operon protein cyoD